MDEGDIRFGGQLRALRKSVGFSQEELAERSGLHVRTIRNLECGHSRWPYRDTLRRLADALDLDAAVRADFIAGAGRRLGPGGVEGGAGAASPEPRDGEEAAAGRSGQPFSPPDGLPVPR
jgi:transcriptional regulator with XRE-family HTH domain